MNERSARSIRIAIGALVLTFSALAQNPPVITAADPQGSQNHVGYAAFWYLGGVSPSCCADLDNKFWTQWPVYLTTNTQDPNPVIQWFTDDQTRLQIVPNGAAGATLISLGHSAPGVNFDIHIWVTVDGVQSAQFPVYINTPWQQSQTDPSPFDANGNMLTCAGNIDARYPNGWVGRVANQVTDLTGALLFPIDARETFENDQALFAGEDWGIQQEATWAANQWQNNTFFDTFAMCWSNVGPPTPQTVAWGNGNTAISSDTQKYWMGSFSRFNGECSQRQADTWYTDHIAIGNISTPVPLINPYPCAQGQFAN